MTLHERLVICLRFAEGLSLAEIAAVLDAGISDIERVLERAIARVRTRVGSQTIGADHLPRSVLA
ncbi:MAG: sigma factor-like helix-turn-helix DNA-binding protein [Phycisphaerae bacterium]|nr:sigma factor-like helix-turn-helix DNA-binding protein [Phycisphaerae bacterium]